MILYKGTDCRFVHVIWMLRPFMFMNSMLKGRICVTDSAIWDFCFLQRFLLCGRLIFGPDVQSLAVTIFLIVAPVACFCVFVGRHLLHHYGNAGIPIMVVAVVYTVYVSSTPHNTTLTGSVLMSCKKCAGLIILFLMVQMVTLVSKVWEYSLWHHLSLV